MNRQELDKKLKQIVDDLKPYKPEKVVLFGSYARKNQNKDSDLDLLIIKKTNKRRVDRIGEVLDLLYKKKYLGTGRYNISTEPIVYTPQEIKNRLSLGGPFVKEILQEGKIIYDKK